MIQSEQIPDFYMITGKFSNLDDAKAAGAQGIAAISSFWK